MLPWIQQHVGKRKRTAISLCLFLAVFFLFSALPMHAQGDTFGLEPISQNTALGNDDIRVVVARIIRAVLGLLGIIALCLVLYAGFTIMTAGGNEEKVTQGKRILINAVIGLAIILSSFAIVQFILSRLAGATGSGGFGTDDQRPGIENFSDSSALGYMIKDVYPFRDQKDVPRNTKIAITFAEPINPETIIANTNNSCWGKEAPCTNDNPPKYGDCVAPPAGLQPDMQRDCDHLIIGAQDYGIAIRRSSEADELIPAVALTTYNADRQAGKFVFDPFEPLGDTIQKIGYTVGVTERVEKLDGTAALPERTNSVGPYEYFWEFETGTTLDLTPPKVVSVIPVEASASFKNTIVQINFDEAMDPTTVQGLVGASSQFANLTFNSADVSGEWRSSNGYKTTEFVSNLQCGVNSCGEKMFCMPAACDKRVNNVCTDEYITIVSTAQLDGSGGFQSFPFSGVTDMSGNALDGNKNNVADGKPNDNFSWTYDIKDAVDRTLPSVETVTPLVDATNVGPDVPIEITFNQPMWSDTLTSIGLEEYRGGGGNKPAQPWYRATFRRGADGRTMVTLEHRPFGPNGQDYYYFTKIPSSVKNVYQNCFYPGRGPGDQVGGFTPVTLDSKTDTGCANLGNVSKTQENIDECIKQLKTISTN